jgi:threonine dehydrogenase-like Zn-dependent dehydrogenase
VKAVFVRDGGGVEVREVDVPEIGDGELLVKMVACGVDGTDLEKAFGRPLTPPMLGHEVVGVVEESRAEMFRKGDRVFVPPPCIVRGLLLLSERLAHDVSRISKGHDKALWFRRVLQGSEG